jgi:hypothetical protein
MPSPSMVEIPVTRSITIRPKTPLLQVGSGQADDQRGFTQILRGIVPAFRNHTHHHVSDSFSQEEAILVVGFIDVLLRLVEGSIDTRDRSTQYQTTQPQVSVKSA